MIFLITLFYFLFLSDYYLYSSQQNFDFSGYLQTDLNKINIYSDKLEQNIFLARNNLRLNFIFKKQKIKFDSSFDLNILYGKYESLYLSSISDNLTQIVDDLYLLTEIRKFYFMLKTQKIDFYLGRQLIKYSQGIIFSPLDTFSKIDFSDIFLNRYGVDAFRIKMDLSNTEYFETIFIPKENLKYTDITSRLGFLAYNYDISTIIYYYNKQNIKSFGLSFKGDFILGLYGEYVYYFKDDLNFSSYLIGFDYSLYQKILFRTEFYKNNYNDNISNIVYDFIKPFFLKTYSMFQITYSPSIITNIYLTHISNFDNNSNLTIFVYQYNVFQNTDLIFSLRQSYKDISFAKDENFQSFYYSICIKIKF
ncbi:MAG: hypothetical protein ACK4WJ_00330 [Endomicrobiia bacterium]